MTNPSSSNHHAILFATDTLRDQMDRKMMTLEHNLTMKMVTKEDLAYQVERLQKKIDDLDERLDNKETEEMIENL